MAPSSVLQQIVTYLTLLHVASVVMLPSCDVTYAVVCNLFNSC